MIYGSLQPKYMETKRNGEIHWYGSPIFVKIAIFVTEERW